jgi:hypothetical protein
MKTQEKQILDYLLSGKKLTPIQALKKFGCFRLGARIWNLKRQGWAIGSRLIASKGKRFSQYYL